MTPVKEDAKRLIERLPDGASWDDVMYEIYVRQKLANAERAAVEGKTMSHAAAKKRLRSA